MYKNLSCELLGISGRQSEIIELALTYGFRGIDIDILDLVKRCERTSFESAARFLISSKLRVGGFPIPIDLDSDDETFAKDLAGLNRIAEIAGRASAQAGILDIPSQTDRLPYPEYFEVVRKRIDEIATIFAGEDVRVAIALKPTTGEDDKQFKFISDAEGFVALASSCKSASILFDSWAWFCGGGTPEQLESIGLDRIASIRLADCVEGVAPSAATPNDCVLPGSTNVIDNASYMTKFAEANLDVPVSACGNLASAGGTRDAFIGQSQDALNQVFVSAGLPSEVRKPEMFANTAYASNDS